MGTEYWILKCPKVISNTEEQRLKIYRGQTLKNTILKTKTQKILKIYMKFGLKIQLIFFLQGYSEMKMKIEE